MTPALVNPNVAACPFGQAASAHRPHQLECIARHWHDPRGSTARILGPILAMPVGVEKYSQRPRNKPVLAQFFSCAGHVRRHRLKHRVKIRHRLTRGASDSHAFALRFNIIESKTRLALQIQSRAFQHHSPDRPRLP